MKILMVTDFYWPYVGGVEQHVRSLSAELVDRGHEVSVATLGAQDLLRFEMDGGVRVHRIQSTTQQLPWMHKNAGRPWAPPLPDPLAGRALAALVRQESPDIVHGHDWLARSYLPLKRRHRPFVMSLHYYTLSCAKKSLMTERDEPCAGPALARCLPCAATHYGTVKGNAVALIQAAVRPLEAAAVDIFLPVSTATAEGNQLDQIGRPYRVVPNFVSTRLDPEPPDLDDFVAQLPDDPYFLFVGDLRPHKGITVLLDAYNRLQKAQSTVPPLVLIGKQWPETPRNLPPNVRFLENWPNYAVMAAWARCLAGVVPSIWAEPFGIVVIEAMSCRRPVIGSNIGGIRDIIQHEQNGLLVPPQDAAALAAAMGRLATDRSLGRRLGQAALERSYHYRAENVVPVIEGIYRQLLQKGTYASNLSPGEHCY